MYVIIVGMIVLLCVSVAHIVFSYREGISPVQLPSSMQKYIRANVVYDTRELIADFITSTCGLLMTVAYPLTYILACINAVVFKQYLYVKHVTIPAIKDYLKH